MDLKQFITETLVQISDGIETAQKQLKESGSEARINTNMTVIEGCIRRTPMMLNRVR